LWRWRLFSYLPWRPSAGTTTIHQEIVWEALPFIKEAYLKVIAEASDDPDGEPPRPLELKLGSPPWSSEWHFDNCYFREDVTEINKKYNEIKPLVAPQVVLANALEVAKLFGHLLHPAQDLYAHSNWVETMAAMGRGGTLFDSGIGRVWVPWGFWSQHSAGVIIAQAAYSGEKERLHKDWKVALDRNKRLVTVTREDRRQFYGIIGGLWGGILVPDVCFDDIAMHHDELHKDERGRPFYEEAREHALRQTVHEWCRLESLVFLRYGQEGLKKLRETFIDPAKKSPCGEFCSLRIRAQDTARNELKGVKISVALGDGWVVDVETPFGPDVVRLGQEVKVEAPAALKEKGLVFVEWKLAEGKPFGGTYMLWPLSSSPRNEWTFKVEKCDLELIARYGPPVEEGPGEVSPPPGEEPPGETPPPPGA